MEKKIMIVSENSMKQYSRVLMTLVSEREGELKEKLFQMAVWSVDEYKKHENTINSDQYIIYIGENEISKNEIPMLKEKFYNYGMSYGWLGKKCYIKVDKNKLSKEDYNDFYKYCTEQGIDIEKLEYGNLDTHRKLVDDYLEKKGAPAVLINFSKKVDNFGDNLQDQLFHYKKVLEQQYNSAINLFYKNAFLYFIG